MFVYVVTCSVNGKVYVGKTADPDKRWGQHLTSARAGKSGPLYDAIREDGAGAFEYAVVEQCESDDLAFDAERQWIERLGATDPARGFNRTVGGNGPAAHGGARYRHVSPGTCAALYAEGLTAPEIAGRLGMGSYQPVYRMLRRAGVTVRNAGRPRAAEATPERCWALYSTGLSLVEVGKRLGCSNQQVRRVLVRAGHTLRDAKASHSRVCRAALDRGRTAE